MLWAANVCLSKDETAYKKKQLRLAVAFSSADQFYCLDSFQAAAVRDFSGNALIFLQNTSFKKRISEELSQRQKRTCGMAAILLLV